MRFHDSPGIPDTDGCPNQTRPDLSSQPAICSQRSCRSRRLPARPPPVLWHVSGTSALASCCFHRAPPQLSHRGPTSHRIGVCGPGAQTASRINLPGPPAVRLSAAAPLLCWTGHSHTSVRQPEASAGRRKYRRAPFHLQVFICLPCPGSGLLSGFVKPKLVVDEQPRCNYGQLPTGSLF